MPDECDCRIRILKFGLPRPFIAPSLASSPVACHCGTQRWCSKNDYFTQRELSVKAVRRVVTGSGKCLTASRNVQENARTSVENYPRASLSPFCLYTPNIRTSLVKKRSSSSAKATFLSSGWPSMSA
jgi:hypothetical protein